MICYPKLGEITLCLSLFFLSACGERSVVSDSPNEASLFLRLDSSQTGINYRNQVQESADFNVLTYRNFYNGGGVAIGDLNQDGWSDVYFTANTAPNQLYLNRGDWTFDEVGKEAKVIGTKSWSQGLPLLM